MRLRAHTGGSALLCADGALGCGGGVMRWAARVSRVIRRGLRADSTSGRTSLAGRQALSGGLPFSVGLLAGLLSV